MAIDIGQGFKTIDKKAQIYPKYKKIRDDQKKLKKKVSDSFDKSEKFAKTQLSEWSSKKQKYQKDVKTSYEELVKLFQLIKGSGAESNSFMKKILSKTLKELKPEIKTILTDSIKKTLGCDLDFQIVSNQTQYVKVQSIDFFNFLTLSAETKVGKLIYEKQNINYFSYPYSMNKSLYDRIQNQNQPISAVAGSDFLGKSGQPLFNIEYVQSYIDPNGQIITGNFFKIVSSQRATPLNIDVFLNDYFQSIDIFDQKNFYTQLINIITGSIFAYQDTSKASITGFQKFLVIMQRILGLCYDGTEEIDVAGNAKVSENDLIDDSFFELTDLELRLIEEKVSQIKMGILEFQECDNVKIVMNNEAVIEALSSIEFFEGTNQTNFLDQTSAVIYNASDGRYKLAFDSSWILEFPKALCTAILSPKVILPIMYLSKTIGSTSVDSTITLEDFSKNFKTFFIEFVSKIGSIFTKTLFKEVKKEIALLIAQILQDILKESKERYKNMIFPLTILGVGVGLKILKDFRDCKSVVDSLTKLLTLALNKKISRIKKAGNDIPLPLLFGAELLDGVSPTRAFVNIIDQFEELGIPTGPMPDGSPNEFMASVLSIVEGIDKENVQNGKTVIATKPLTVTPLFLTTPQKIYGKSF